MAEEASNTQEQPNVLTQTAEQSTGGTVSQAVPELTTTTQTPEQTEQDKVAKRFSELTRREQAAVRRAEEAERLAAKTLEILQSSGASKQSVEETKKEDPKPEPPKFADMKDPAEFAGAMAQYTERLTDWSARRMVDARIAEQSKGEEKRKEQDQIARMDAEYRLHRAKALTELPDFETVAEDPNLSVTQTMAAAIKSSGALGPKVLYYLGQNPEEATRIASLPPGMQFMEIGVVKARLELGGTKPGTTQTKLPPPIKPTGQGRSTTKDVHDMNMDEYAAHRKAQLRAERAGH